VIDLTPGWSWLALLGVWLLTLALAMRINRWLDQVAGRKAEVSTTVVGPESGTESGA
jgi:hypothetical protein